MDNLEQVYATARNAGATLPPAEPPGVGPMGRIATRPWGERSFYVEDPFGNQLCFVDRGTVFTGG